MLDILEKNYKSNNLEFFNFIQSEYDLNTFRYIAFKKGMWISRVIQADYVYYIKKGVLKCSYYDYQGNHKSICIVGENELLGVTTFFHEILLNWEIHVLEDVELIVLPKNCTEKYAQESSDIMSSHLAYYLSMFSLSWQVMSSEGVERINYALLMLTHKLGMKKSEVYYFPSYVNHELIASFAAVSRSYVTRHLKILEMNGVVKFDCRRITIVNKQKLMSYTPNYNI